MMLILVCVERERGKKNIFCLCFPVFFDQLRYVRAPSPAPRNGRERREHAQAYARGGPSLCEKLPTFKSVKVPQVESV